MFFLHNYLERIFESNFMYSEKNMFNGIFTCNSEGYAIYKNENALVCSTKSTTIIKDWGEVLKFESEIIITNRLFLIDLIWLALLIFNLQLQFLLN